MPLRIKTQRHDRQAQLTEQEHSDFTNIIIIIMYINHTYGSWHGRIQDEQLSGVKPPRSLNIDYDKRKHL